MKGLMLRFMLRSRGYRQYRFTLYTGRVITFWATTPREADIKALRYERCLRDRQRRIQRNRETIMRTLMGCAELWPMELIANVLDTDEKKLHDTPEQRRIIDEVYPDYPESA
jgi:hypothetical protein